MKKSLKIFLKIIVIIIFVFVIFMIGRKIYYKSLKIEPYEIYVESKITNEKLKLNAYSYKWTDKGILVIGDGVLPKIGEETKFFNAKQGEKLYFTNYDNTSVVASVINVGTDGNFSVSLDSNNDENYFIVPNSIGKHLIGISLTSEKNGNANYAFIVDIKE